MKMVEHHRSPYVGEGADGARRSADIDRNEADTYPTGSDDWQRCQASAERWETQATEIEMLAAGPQPYRVTFDRIGRNHHVPDLDVSAIVADEIAEAAQRYARRYITSRDFVVSVDLAEGRVYIEGGRFGTGTVQLVPADGTATPTGGN
jgi:hypothetical protein